jgi:DNA-binding response OmpR family regulator
LILTAAATSADLVDGRGLGADGLLPKPFDFPVLVARVRALIRRAPPAIPPLLGHGDLVVDAAQCRSIRGGRRLALAPVDQGRRAALNRWRTTPDQRHRAIPTATRE